jgi:hypothetical protein
MPFYGFSPKAKHLAGTAILLGCNRSEHMIAGCFHRSLELRCLSAFEP